MARLAETYARLPLHFEANKGQTDSRVKFLARGGGYTMFLTPTEAVVALRNAKSTEAADQGRRSDDQRSAALRMKLAGANRRPQITAVDELPGKVNYFIGKNPARWRQGISTFRGVRYEGVYPGIDVTYHGNQRQLEYDFVVAPGASPQTIRLSFEGAEDVSIDVASGDLVLRTAAGEIRQPKPLVYQEVDGVRHEIAGQYTLLTGKASIRNPQSAIRNRLIGFEIADYDSSRPLIIDPVLVYSTYLGGNSQGEGYGIAVDSNGSAYVVGYTNATNFPTANAFQSTKHGNPSDAFVTKFNPTGSALVYSTYLGGTGDANVGYAIDVDGAGNAFVTGRTFTTNFPVTPSAYQSTYIGSTQGMAFVTRFDASGQLVYSTYFGNSQGTRGLGIVTDGTGNAYVTGQASGSAAFPFPTTPSAYLQNGTGFLSKVNTNASGASSLVYSTMLSSGNFTNGRAIALDVSGNVYMAGNTGDSNFATTGAAQTTLKGTQDAFVAKFNTNLSGSASRIYATYLGGSGSDQAGQSNNAAPSKCIAIDANGNAYVTGLTPSTDFPVTQDAYQSTKGGVATKISGFLTKLNATGSAFLYSTYLGGTGSATEGGYGVAVNVVGNVYVTGLAATSDFPTQSPLPTNVGGTNGGVFLTKFTPTGALVYSTRLGCVSNGNGNGVALDGAGNAFLTGSTGNCTTFPTVNPFPGSGNFGNSAFVSVIPDPTIIGRVVDENGAPIPGATVNLSGVPTGTTTTDANGYFTFGLLTVANNYTVSVSVPNYIFNSQTVNNLQKNVRLDFSPVVVSISGQVTLGGGGLSAATMTLSGGKSLSTQTDANGNYSFINLPAGRDYTVTPSKPGFSFAPPSRTFTNILVNQTANFVAAATFQFSVGSYTGGETAGLVTITVTRTSGASGPASVDYVTSDGTALQRTDYTITIGTLNFAANETSKSFDVPIIDDLYVEGDETFNVTLSNPVGATLGTPNPALVTITDNDTVAATTNPLDNADARFFVRQHYLDFLSRVPDQGGFDYWAGQITQCGTNQTCVSNKRVDVSNAFFYELEYQQTGSYVQRLYRAAYGNNQPFPNPDNSNQTEARKLPSYAVFGLDRALVVGGSNLAQAQLDLANKFVVRPEFLVKYPASLSTAELFVDAVLATIQNDIGVNLTAERTHLITLYNSLGRGGVIYRLADDNLQTNPINNRAFIDAEYNRTFVLGEYFGYLRRDPDIGGFLFWLGQVNRFLIRDGNAQHAMVCSFITSAEYEQRFSPIVTRTNAECPQ